MRFEIGIPECGKPGHIFCDKCVDDYHWCVDCDKSFTNEHDAIYHVHKTGHGVKNTSRYIFGKDKHIDYGKYFPKESDR